MSAETAPRQPRPRSSGILPFVIIAVVAAGGYWFWREGQIRECRASASAASTIDAPYTDARINAALAISREMSAQRVRKCYEDGFLQTPYG